MSKITKTKTEQNRLYIKCTCTILFPVRYQPQLDGSYVGYNVVVKQMPDVWTNDCHLTFGELSSSLPKAGIYSQSSQHFLSRPCIILAADVEQYMVCFGSYYV